MRRTIVPVTVGNRRRDGCQRPSGKTIRGPATPQRGCSSMNRRSVATAPGAGTASGFDESTSSAVVSRTPWFTFAPKPSGRSLCIASTPVWDRAGDVRDHDELVDLRRERGQRLLELGRVPVRDDDRSDLHAASTFRYTAAVSSAVSPPREVRRPLEPRRAIPVARRASAVGDRVP